MCARDLTEQSGWNYGVPCVEFYSPDEKKNYALVELRYVG